MKSVDSPPFMENVQKKADTKTTTKVGQYIYSFDKRLGKTSDFFFFFLVDIVQKWPRPIPHPLYFGHCEVTFVSWGNFFKARNSQYLGKMASKLLEHGQPPPPVPPFPQFNVQKVVKIGESKTPSKLLDSGWTPPPFGQCPKERLFFFMASLSQTALTVKERMQF